MIPSRPNDKIFFAQRRRWERHVANVVAALQEQVVSDRLAGAESSHSAVKRPRASFLM
jgi:hypothetical protein